MPLANETLFVNMDIVVLNRPLLAQFLDFLHCSQYMKSFSSPSLVSALTSLEFKMMGDHGGMTCSHCRTASFGLAEPDVHLHSPRNVPCRDRSLFHGNACHQIKKWWNNLMNSLIVKDFISHLTSHVNAQTLPT